MHDETIDIQAVRFGFIGTAWTVALMNGTQPTEYDVIELCAKVGFVVSYSEVREVMNTSFARAVIDQSIAASFNPPIQSSVS
jgi:hypothetical protein